MTADAAWCRRSPDPQRSGHFIWSPMMGDSPTERSLQLAYRQVDNMAAVLREIHDAIGAGDGSRIVSLQKKIEAVLPSAAARTS